MIVLTTAPEAIDVSDIRGIFNQILKFHGDFRIVRSFYLFGIFVLEFYFQRKILTFII